MWMNEWEVEDNLIRFNRGDTPNLGKAAFILTRLVIWTNRNSDGWPYWSQPSNAAGKLMELFQSKDRFDPEDATEAEIRKAMSPIKAFLTRRGVDHDVIFNPPLECQVADCRNPAAEIMSYPEPDGRSLALCESDAAYYHGIAGKHMEFQPVHLRATGIHLKEA